MFKWSTSLKSRLVILFLLIGLIPVILTSFLIYNNARTNIEREVLNANRIVAQLKEVALNEFFQTNLSSAQFVANTRDITTPLRNLSDMGGFEGNQDWFSHSVAGPVSTVVEEFPFSMVTLLDNSGVVAYSTEEELVGVDLSGYSFVQQALAADTAWSDMFYLPQVDDNIIALAVPVRAMGGNVLGVAKFAFTQPAIDALVHDRTEHLGTSANVYLIDENGLLISNTSRGAYAEGAALNQRISTRAVDLLRDPIRNGDLEYNDQVEYTSYEENRVLGGLQTVSLGDKVVGMVVEIDQSEVLAPILAMRNLTLLVAALCALLALVVSVSVASGISKPVIELKDLSQKVAAGDYKARAQIKRQDELGILGSSFNDMINSLQSINEAILEAVDKAVNVSQELSASSEQNSASIEEVSSTINEFASTLEQVNDSSQRMAEEANSVKTVSEQGSEKMQETNATMQQVLKLSTQSQEVMDRLAEASGKISNITEFISDVAEKTNLLALNAAIEAARAGEHGRGFAVVADEVRTLAEQTQNSVSQIRVIVDQLGSELANAVKTISENSEATQEGVKVLETTGELFRDIVTRIDGLVNVIEQIAESREQLDRGSQDIASSSQQQAASMSEMSKTAETVATIAEELRELMRSVSKDKG